MFTDGPIGALTNTSGVAPMTGAGAVNAQGTPNMTVAVTGGDFHITATPTSQGSQRFNVTLTTQNATIAANATGSTRYDWIYVSLSASALANPSSDGSSPSSVVVSRSTSATTDNGTPPTYGVAIAVVTVANGAVSITNGNIADVRIKSGVSSILPQTWDGWIGSSSTWVYASATTITVPLADAQSMAVGDRIKLTQTTVKYFYVIGISGTTITVTGGSDYTVANATITNAYYSHMQSPVGFPQWFNYSPTWAGFSSSPSGGIIRFSIQGRTVNYTITPTSAGTSNATTTTITLPVTASSVSNGRWNGVIRCSDNGTASVAGFYEFNASATTANIYPTPAAASWTASGTKLVQGMLVYEI